jgi:acyl-CoA synthetase (AMP-forming)/AMP-acid ligase II
VTSPVIDAGDGLPLTIPALLRRHMAARADAVLLVCDDLRLTYAEVEARSRRLARGLLAAGACKGSHVALLHPNGPDFLIGALAAARIGAVVLPFSTLSTADELRWLLTHSDTGFLLAAPAYRSHRYAEALLTALPGLDYSRPQPFTSHTAPWLKRIWFSGALPDDWHPSWSVAALEGMAAGVSEDHLAAIEARVSPADRFVIIHTSGSTSTPKGVMHIQGAAIRYLDNLTRIRNYQPGDVLFSQSPWFWTAGFYFALFSTVVAGMCLVTSNADSASDVLDLIERERPNIGNGWAGVVERLAADPSFARRDLSFLRRGNLWPIMPPELRPRDPNLRHGTYGQTEVGSTLTASGDEGDLPERLRGAFGKVLPGFEVKIVDPDSGKDCATGELGEVWVRGPFVMEGYYGKTRAQVFEPDGWFRSNDMGLFDAEGYFYFKNRLNDMIKTAGANVAPREVEAVLRDLVPGLACYVVGVPDAQRGQLVAAAVVSDNPAEVDEAELREQLAARLSSYKVPRRIVRLPVADMPLMHTGKPNIRALTALMAERLR